MNQAKKKRGRPAGTSKTVKFQKEAVAFDPTSIKLFRGKDLSFDESLFKPMKTKSELDIILSTEGGIMPGTNMVLVGGPGSGKSTVALDMLARLTKQGYKCLFVSAEMDEIAHYKYCKRMPKFSIVQTLFLKNYSENVREVLEHTFNEGYDIVVIDSIAEVIDMYKDAYNVNAGAAEFWFLNLQDLNKKGENSKKYYTTFVNIQQQTKSGDFAGSNRLKHMTDGMCHIEKSKDGLERSMYFSKNRDCDKDFKMYFTIYNDTVMYSYASQTEQVEVA